MQHFTCYPYGAQWDSLSSTQADERQLDGAEYVVVLICCLQHLHSQGMVAWACVRSLVQWWEYWLSALPLAFGLHRDCQKAASLAICWGEIPFPPCENGNILKKGEALMGQRSNWFQSLAYQNRVFLATCLMADETGKNLLSLVVLGVCIYK